MLEKISFRLSLGAPLRELFEEEKKSDFFFLSALCGPFVRRFFTALFRALADAFRHFMHLRATRVDFIYKFQALLSVFATLLQLFVQFFTRQICSSRHLCRRNFTEMENSWRRWKIPVREMGKVEGFAFSVLHWKACMWIGKWAEEAGETSCASQHPREDAGKRYNVFLGGAKRWELFVLLCCRFYFFFFCFHFDLTSVCALPAALFLQLAHEISARVGS